MGAERPRVFEVQEGTLSARYRYIDNSAGVRTTNQLQDKVAFRARLTPRATEWLSVDFGAFSGSSFTGSWNNTGLGTGDRAMTVSVKQLYASVRPWKTIDAQVGSLYAARGESTEITNYDNDAYLTGERVTVHPSRRFFVDSVTFTSAYVGDLMTPNVFRRLNRLGDANFLQALAQKGFAHHVSVSAEWSQPPEGNMVRGAGRCPLPGDLSDITVRVESYWRVRDHAAGFAVTAERPVGRRVQVGGGFADLDRRFPPTNGDRYGNGRRLFAQGSVTITKTLSASAFFTQAISTPFPISTAQRFDAVVTYNVAGAVMDAWHRHASSTAR